MTHSNPVLTETTIIPATPHARINRRRGAPHDALTLYHTVFAKSTEAIAILDADGRYLEQNAAHARLVGYDDDALFGQTPAIHLGDTVFAEIVAELRASGHCRRECVCRTPDGRAITIELSAFAIRNAQGEPVCYVGTKRDVSDEKRAAAELRQQLHELQAIYRMAEAVGRAGALEDIYDLALDELQRTVGADRASVLLADADGVMRFAAWRGLSDEYRRAVEGHSPWSPDEPDPKPVLVSDVAGDPDLAALLPTLAAEGIAAVGFIPLVDAGRLLGKFMVYYNRPHDIQPSELRLAQAIASHIAFAITRARGEAALRESEQVQRRLAREAHEANLAKSEFLRTMSHELRTPLNAIAGYTELLQLGLRGPITGAQADDLARIQRSQEHLLGLINDLLSFARIESGHLSLELEPVALSSMLDGVATLLEPQMAAKQLRFRCRTPDQGVACRVDRDRVRQVLVNLLSNAVKFTPAQGAVSVDWDASPDTVRVYVTDTGPGIPAYKQEEIFEPFVQLEGGPTRSAEGTGLGLAISRELARAMGGDVTVVSAEGQGATFTLTVPRAV